MFAASRERPRTSRRAPSTGPEYDLWPLGEGLSRAERRALNNECKVEVKSLQDGMFHIRGMLSVQVQISLVVHEIQSLVCVETAKSRRRLAEQDRARSEYHLPTYIQYLSVFCSCSQLVLPSVVLGTRHITDRATLGTTGVHARTSTFGATTLTANPSF